MSGSTLPSKVTLWSDDCDHSRVRLQYLHVLVSQETILKSSYWLEVPIKIISRNFFYTHNSMNITPLGLKKNEN